MHWRLRFGLLLAVTVLLVIAAGKVRSEVLLNEVLADPASDWDGDGSYSSRNDEWVEIINTGPAPVDLDGYRLAGAEGDWRYAFTGTLAPGAVRVVYGGESYDWELETGNPAFGLRLTNTGSSVGLWKLTAADSTMVDCYTYLDHEAEDDRASGRLPDGGPEWKVLDAHNPYDGTEPPFGTGCAPTPGGPASCPTAVEPETWSGIKRFLR